MNYRKLGKTGLEVSELSMGGLFVASFATEKEEARTQRSGMGQVEGA